MIKKLVMLIIASMAVIGLECGSVFGEEYQSVRLLINGNEVSTDQPAVIYNSRTVVPVRVILEYFDCQVDWIADTKTVAISQDNVNLYMTVGSNTVTATMENESVSVEIDTPPVIINGRTMIPVAFISENLGFKADWDGETKTVNIYDGSANGLPSELKAKYDEAGTRFYYYVEKIADPSTNLTDEQFETYTDIFNRYLKIDITDGVTEAEAEQLCSIAEEMDALAAKVGIAYGTEKSDVPEKTAESELRKDILTVIIDVPYDYYSEDCLFDEDTIVMIVNNFGILTTELGNNMDKMSIDNLKIFNEYLEKGQEYLANINDDLKASTDPAIKLNGVNCELAAMAEGLGLNLGENMKDYDVTINNPLYNSDDIVQVREAFYAALKKNNDYGTAITSYFTDFTSQQFDEYIRIDDPYMFYSFNNEEQESIEYYMEGLKLYDISNARAEIFAEKYGIDL